MTYLSTWQIYSYVATDKGGISIGYSSYQNLVTLWPMEYMEESEWFDIKEGQC